TRSTRDWSSDVCSSDLNAAGYFGYFGAAAATPGKGYYSYDLGDWHVIAINSELDVSPSSAELQWLRADLAANTKLCTLAYWHERSEERRVGKECMSRRT